MTPLPHNPEVEQGVLSVCLKDNGETYRRCIEAGVTAFAFMDPRNARIWEAFKKMPVPDVSLLNLEPPDQTGGMAYILQVDNKAPTTTFAGHLIKQLLELATKRELI